MTVTGNTVPQQIQTSDIMEAEPVHLMSSSRATYVNISAYLKILVSLKIATYLKIINFVQITPCLGIS